MQPAGYVLYKALVIKALPMHVKAMCNNHTFKITPKTNIIANIITANMIAAGRRKV